MRALICLLERRVYGSEKFRSAVQKDFCNKICQSATFAPQQNNPLFDYLVSASHDGLRDLYTERFCG